MLIIGFSYAAFYWLLYKQIILPGREENLTVWRQSRIHGAISPCGESLPAQPISTWVAKKPTNLCVPREFLKKCLSFNLIILTIEWTNLLHTLAAWSAFHAFDLDVLRAQGIRLFTLITHKPTRSEHPIAWLLLTNFAWLIFSSQGCTIYPSVPPALKVTSVNLLVRPKKQDCARKVTSVSEAPKVKKRLSVHLASTVRLEQQCPRIVLEALSITQQACGTRMGVPTVQRHSTVMERDSHTPRGIVVRGTTVLRALMLITRCLALLVYTVLEVCPN